MAFLLNPDHRYRFFSSGSIEMPQLLPNTAPDDFVIGKSEEQLKPFYNALSSVACNLWNFKKIGSAVKLELSIVAGAPESISLLEGGLVGASFFQNNASGFFSAVDEEDLLGSFWFLCDGSLDLQERPKKRNCLSDLSFPAEKGDVLFLDHNKTKALLQQSPFEMTSQWQTKQKSKLQVQFLDKKETSRGIYFGSLIFKDAAWRRVRDQVLSKWIRSRYYQHTSHQIF